MNFLPVSLLNQTNDIFNGFKTVLIQIFIDTPYHFLA